LKGQGFALDANKCFGFERIDVLIVFVISTLIGVKKLHKRILSHLKFL